MYEIGTITYSVSPIYKLEKGGQGTHDIFQMGGGVGYTCHHVTTHSHELMSLVSSNCVNNIECSWSRSHNLSATIALIRFISHLNIQDL